MTQTCVRPFAEATCCLKRQKMSAVFWLLLWATGAVAQEAPAALQEIVVTATKRSEALQDVPFAISALTGADLQAMGADSFTDYARDIPGLTFTDYGAGREKPAIRGLNASIGSDTVGYYIGETPLPTTGGTVKGTIANPELIDIDRIEVLRGPQGTLYGSGSVGGTIRLLPALPDLSKLSGYANVNGSVTEAHGASWGTTASLVLNTPIVDGVAALRTVVWGRDVGGFVDRTFGYTGTFTSTPPQGTVKNIPDEHTWGVRSIALLKPTDNFTLSAMVYHQNQHFDGFQDITGGSDNPTNRLVQDLVSDTPEPSTNSFTLSNVVLKYDFSNFEATSATSYYESRNDYFEEGTSDLQVYLGEPAFANSMEDRNSIYNFTEEARLASTHTLYGFDEVVGIFISRYSLSRGFFWSPPDYNSIAAPDGPTDPLYSPGNNVYTDIEGGHEHQVSEFGEFTYHFTDALAATLGLRHYRIANDHTDIVSGLFNNFAAPAELTIYNYASTSSGMVYKGNLSYKIAPEKLIYAQFSEGFRPGFGQTPVNSACDVSPTSLTVEPDSIKNYELGAKTTWLEQRLTWNVAIYRIDWKNIQQEEFLPCGFNLVGNAGSAINKGIESEMHAQLSSQIDTGFSFNYLSAKIDQSSPAFGTYPGDQIENVPQWQGAVFLGTKYSIWKPADGFARLEYQYTGSSYGNYNRLDDGERDPLSKLGVTRLLNFRTAVNFNALQFSFNVSNILDQTEPQAIETALGIDIPGRPRYVVNRPRTWMLGLRYEF